MDEKARQRIAGASRSPGDTYLHSDASSYSSDDYLVGGYSMVSPHLLLCFGLSLTLLVPKGKDRSRAIFQLIFFLSLLLSCG